MNNPVNWFEIATVDLNRAKNFYKNVFNAEFEHISMPGTEMEMFKMGGEAQNYGGGALVKTEDNTPSTEGTIIYFSCKDVSEEASRVEGAGGKLLFPKMSIGDFGFISQFIDTEGNRIGLHSSK